MCYLKAETFHDWFLFYLEDESNRFLWHVVSVCHTFQLTLRLCNLSCHNLISLMKWQFVITHTICRTEIPTLLDRWVKNTPSFKLLWSRQKCCSIQFCKNITCLGVVLLRICHIFSVSWETVYWWVMIHSCFMSVMSR